MKDPQFRDILLDFPNLIEIDGALFVKRDYMRSFQFLSGSFSKAPLSAIKHIRLQCFKIWNNRHVKRIDGNDYSALENPSTLGHHYENTNLTHIGDGAFKTLISLHILILTGNKLRFISPDILSAGKGPNDIDLSNNDFGRFPREFVKSVLLVSTTVLKRFNFDGNDMMEMDKDDWNVTVNGPSGSEIKMNGMLINCTSCALTPIVEWRKRDKAAKRRSYNFFQDRNVVYGNCTYPKEKKNLQVYALREKDLSHCF